MMTRICVSSVLIIALVVASFGDVFEHKVEAASDPKGAYIAATTTYQGGGNKSTSSGIDMFMSVADANAYAAKLNISYKSTIAWGTAAFIKGVGPYISVVGIINTLESQKKAKQILALTKKKKKVHVSVKYGMISVKEWNGKASSVKTSMPKSSTNKYGGITTKTTTKVTKKQLKY